ncbi:MAG: hypothetical protein M1832_001016 [Thelocarpon impressellum]|nr:MAG: hypothetical protein M1832_001016 [Thelocarpon impressellum]
MEADSAGPAGHQHPHLEHSSSNSAASSLALKSLLRQSVLSVPTMSSEQAGLACCCGREECAFLKHNHSALEGLERSVQTAAQLGQALLVRHEAYMADAERDRGKMNATIEQLESEKREVESENARRAEENRELLDQLEGLNAEVSDSDAHVRSLEATLLSTQRELQRVATLAAKTAELELQLTALEQERAELQQSLATTEKEERCAIQRWRKAERTLEDLQDQIERIETEAKEERERHVEIVGRLEKGRQAEREMAGRARGAASTVGSGSTVVSHFVKDILQDNAKLQMGIVELREMLEHSNEDVQQLREQLMLHQSVEAESREMTSLQEELDPLDLDLPTTISQELHVHHHYHAAERAKDRTGVRRTKKRRSVNVTTPGLFTPPSGPQAPRTPTPRTPRSHAARPVPALTPLNAQAGGSTSNRWSMQSTHTQSSATMSSSVPSSPQSVHQQASVFDRAYTDATMDSSRPTSPESNAPCSPLFAPHHRPRGSDASYRSFTVPAPFQPKTTPSLAATTLHEEVDDETALPDLDLGPGTEEGDEVPSARRFSLHRATSHESLISVSGMDIHTLQHRPSQLHLRLVGSARVPASLSSSRPVLGATAVTATATARPALAPRRHDSTAYNRRLLHGTTPPPSEDSSLGKRVGGWVWSRWGSPSPSPSPAQLDPLAAALGRAPGVNQAGPIRGLRAPLRKAPSRVLIEEGALDRELLAESLRDG